MASNRYTIEDLENAVKRSKSWKEVCESLGLKGGGGSQSNLKKLSENNKIDYSHFNKLGWNFYGNSKNEIPINEALVKNSQCYQGSVKAKVLKYKLIDYVCDDCGLEGIWNGKDITLHLDHINGTPSDNRIENLRFLCPNCHSQTPTYCRNGVKRDQKKSCLDCGKKIWHRNKKGVCRECCNLKNACPCSKMELQNLVVENSLASVGKEFGVGAHIVKKWCVEQNITIPSPKQKSTYRRKFEASREELSKMLENMSFCEIGRSFGVSDNAVRKRAKLLGLLQ